MENSMPHVMSLPSADDYYHNLGLLPPQHCLYIPSAFVYGNHQLRSPTITVVNHKNVLVPTTIVGCS